jgi:transposase-like protein
VLEEKVGSTVWAGGLGNVIVKPRRVEHEDVYAPAGTRMLMVIVGDETAGPYRWFFGGPQAALFVRAFGNWRAGEAIGVICTDLVASAHSGLKAGHSARLRGVAERIATTDATVSNLARELGMHPVALARAFRREQVGAQGSRGRSRQQAHAPELCREVRERSARHDRGQCGEWRTARDDRRSVDEID